MPDAPLRRRVLSVVFASTACIGVAYASAFRRGGVPAWGNWLMAFGVSLLLVATMTLGAVRRGPDFRRLVIPFALTFVILFGGFALALALPATERAGMTLVLGLPLRAAIVLYGIGVFPLLLLPLVYAFTFDELTLSERDIAAVREARARMDADCAS